MPRHAPFTAGNSGGGRRVGARNRLQTTFLEALAEDFEVHGVGAIRVARTEKPLEYLRVIASVLPRELQIEQSALSDMSDEDIAATLSLLQRLKLNKETNKQQETEVSDEPATQH